MHFFERGIHNNKKVTFNSQQQPQCQLPLIHIHLVHLISVQQQHKHNNNKLKPLSLQQTRLKVLRHPAPVKNYIHSVHNNEWIFQLCI